MPSFQKVIVLGNLGKDVELRFTANGKAVASFSVATNERWTDSSGQQQEHTEWFRCTAWERRGEVIAQHFSKGDSILVEGTMRTRQYAGQDGATRYITDLIVTNFSFVGRPKTDAGPAQEQEGSDDDDDFLPFE